MNIPKYFNSLICKNRYIALLLREDSTKRKEQLLRHAKLGWSRLVGVVAIASAVFCGLGHPVRADLFVSDLNNNNGQVRKFTDTGTPVPAVPFIGGGDGGSLELRGSRIVK